MRQNRPLTRRPKKRALQESTVVHDPRAPRLAAAATLAAALTVILTAVNLVLDVVGTPGFSPEEGIGLGVMLVMLVVANLASKERAIPELTHADARPDAEAFDTLVSTAPLSNTGSVNPTTASILTSILGENQTTDQAQVNSAISTLSSGEFGAEVQRTMAAVEAANQTNIAPREAAPADEETGQTLERVLVQPVPLPGQDDSRVRDPSTIPGLQPGRAFVTDGVASVPLPTQASGEGVASGEAPAKPPPQPSPQAPAPIPASADSSTVPPTMPSLDELFAEGTDEPNSKPVDAEPSFESTTPMLPDLDDLFTELPEPQPATTVISTPAPTTASSLHLPDLPDLDELL